MSGIFALCRNAMYWMPDSDSCVCVCEEDSPSCSVSAGLLSFPLAGDYAAHISPSALGWPFGSQGP